MARTSKKTPSFFTKKVSKPPYQMESDISEPQIERDISHYFGVLSPIGAAPFILWDGDEPITGADAKFDCAVPIYMQFKVSQGLRPVRMVPVSNRKNRSALEDIRQFRHDNELEDNPTLYFGLRKKAKNADEFQHNLLLRLANTPNFHAIYVAPLTLDKNAYSHTLFNSASSLPGYPFYFEDYIMIHQRRWASYLGTVPFLRNFVSIVPHEYIDTECHYYSFSQNGTDIAWHSPQTLENGPSRLGDMLSRIVHRALGSNEYWLPLNKLVSTLNELEVIKNFTTDDFSNSDESALRALQNHGRRLNDQFGIKQVLLLSNFEFLRRK